MKFIFRISILLSIFIPSILNGQVCGLHDHAPLIERLKANKAFLKMNPSLSRDAVTYIPLKFHLIANAAGLGRVNEHKVLDQLANLNSFYQEFAPDIQFYMVDGLNYIDNDAAFSTHFTGAGQAQLINNRVDNALNVFIPLDANTTSGGQGITLGYYDPNSGADWVVIRKADINGQSETLSHEVGHFLGLLHPFNGWDFEPFDNNTVNPVGTYSPSVGFPSLIPNEKQNGSNCETAGDFICDTPPDYNHFNTNWEFNYVGGAKDPDGVTIDPDETNIMSYFINCNPKSFTTDQVNLMTVDVVQRIANNTLNQGPASFASVGDETALSFPLDEALNVPHNEVEFIWDDVDGATAYLLEIDKFSTFNIEPERYFVYGNNKVISGIDANRTYYWRVRPFNAYDTFSPNSETRKFTTGNTTNTNEIAALKDWAITPNPISTNESLKIMINADQAFEADIEIFSLNGKLVQKISNQYFGQGQQSIETDLSKLNKGIYIVSLVSEKGILNKKIAIQ